MPKVRASLWHSHGNLPDEPLSLSLDVVVDTMTFALALRRNRGNKEGESGGTGIELAGER